MAAPITLSPDIPQNPCFYLQGLSSTIQANTSTSIAVINDCQQPGGRLALYLYGGVSLNQPGQIIRLASNTPIFVNAVAGGDFTVALTTTGAGTLTPSGSVYYPISVTSENGFAGTVSLAVPSAPALGGPPAGVNCYFGPVGILSNQVYVSSGGSAQTTLTCSGAPTMPGGSSSLQLTAQSSSLVHSINFALSTQVTTFQVTSVTGSAIVHNNGQEVQVTQNVPANNAPNYTTCSSADPNVTCRVISSSAGAATLGITGAEGTVPGTRVLSLNGGAGKLHAALVSMYPVGLVSITPSQIQAGQGGPGTISGFGFDTCDVEGQCGNPEVIVDGPGNLEIDAAGIGLDTIPVQIYADPDSMGSYDVYVSLCGGYWDPSDDMNPFACIAGPALFTVTAAPPAPPGPSVTGISPSIGLVGNSVSVTIAGTGFGSAPTVSVAGGVTVSGVSVNPAGTQISATFAIPASASAGGDQAVTVTAQSGASDNSKKFHVQVPSKMVRLDAAGAPDGVGPLVTVNGQNVVNLNGDTVAINQCGVYRNYAFDIEESNGTSINGAYTWTEKFSNYTTTVTGLTAPPSKGWNFSGDGNVTDIQYFGKTAPACPGANDHESYDMTFTVTISQVVFSISTVQHVNRGYYNGTATVDANITTQ